MEFAKIAEVVGKSVEGVGVAVTVIGVAWALTKYVLRTVRERDGGGDEVYRDTRRSVGRAVLLGLEVLVAGDIIRTVAVAPTFSSIGLLGLVVLIRTFLSFTIELEITSRWPWQGPHGPDD
jgi:uncharacterized membrane protein